GAGPLRIGLPAVLHADPGGLSQEALSEVARGAAGDRVVGRRDGGASAAAARRFPLRRDLRLARRHHDRAFLFLARRTRDGHGCRAQRGAGRHSRRGGGPHRPGRHNCKGPGGKPPMTSPSNGLRQGKRGTIMGLANEKSLAWGIAQKLAEHGAEMAFSYQGEALERRVRPLAEQLGSDFCFDCDVSQMEALDTAFGTLRERWETIDFLVHAIGFSDKNELRGKYVDT